MLGTLASTLNGQSLWPGDVNDNGLVNGVDVLYGGVAYGSSGNIRAGATTNWQGQVPPSNWVMSFPSGVNFSYADCNGDGIVNEPDLDVIELNFAQTHGELQADTYSTDNNGNAPRLSLLPQNTSIGIGTMLAFDLRLGSTDFLVEDFYGIALRLRYNPDFTLGSEWEFEDEENAWYDPSDSASEDVFVVNESSGSMELAITRTNQQSITGAGKLGEFTVVVEDIVFGLAADTLELFIEQALLIDQELNILPVVLDSSFVVISRPSTTIQPPSHPEIQLYPNPTQNQLHIRSSSPITSLIIRACSGQAVFTLHDPGPNAQEVHLSLAGLHLPSQLYLIELQTETYTTTRKLLLKN